MAGRAAYHHGDLRAALVNAAMAVIAENGTGALSVAEAARRAGVSTAAPYRHFAGRPALLAAVAAQAARQLAADLSRAAGQISDDPERAVARLAATAGAYVRFVARRRAGIELIFADELAERGDPELAEAGRAVMDVLLPLALDITGGDAPAALKLLEHHMVSAHGYAVLHLSGFLNRAAKSTEEVAREATELSRLLAAAAAAAGGARGTGAAGATGPPGPGPN